MKRRWAFITFLAATLLLLALAPVHAGKALLDNNHRQNAYAIDVSFVSATGTNVISVCAAVDEEHAVEDALASASKISVYRPVSCTNGKPQGRNGSVLQDYNVPGTLSVKRAFAVTVGTDASIQIVESAPSVTLF